ncbi:HNH endonuclease signature motif containing protein [Arcobacter sp.]|uniref:HNH endonuclease signature motif containing protein n=1 Tax=Arcobacter sp. TaxID=1872629 RepID=UPI003D0DA42B
MNHQTYDKNRPSIPAEIRRAIEVEAGHMCTIKDCREHTYLYIHHINENREDNRKDNLILVCDKHHKMAHKKVISRKALKDYKLLRTKQIHIITELTQPWKNNVSQLYYINVPRLAILSEILGYKINTEYFEKLPNLNSIGGEISGVLRQFSELLNNMNPLSINLKDIEPTVDDFIGLTVSFNRRFYTKNVPGYDDFIKGKYKILGDYMSDPQIYSKVDEYKVVLNIDPKWLATVTSFVNMRSRNSKFAGLCTIKDIYHNEKVVIATPIIIGMPNSPMDIIFSTPLEKLPRSISCDEEDDYA